MDTERYHKKPVVIEAWLLSEENAKEIVALCGGRRHRTALGNDEPVLTHITIPTLEGEMTAQKGDFVIRGIKGEFYPCKPDIFALTYEGIPNE